MNFPIIPSNILLSIVTVVRNDPCRLNKTIKSLNSYYNDERFEHIIIDGGSNDETVGILDDLKRHSNVKTRSEADRGIYDGMNKGITQASGKYILFLNCGDEMRAKPFEISEWCVKLINTTIDIVCFPCLVVDELGVSLLMPKLPNKYMTPTTHQAMLFSSAYLMNNRFEINYKIAGDFDLYLRAENRNILIIGGDKILTAIEREGFASGNPFLAYVEYIKIAINRLHGLEKFFALTRIISKAIIIIILKKIINKKWMRKLQEYYDNYFK
ncbi:glycosyltransferase [Polynucleobacter paneuropaeus]|jgi:glycosyltransferase involved in cell wall biosynthesis|nr:glycosyltransferase [Polynucleobacter paneuropaeus]